MRLAMTTLLEEVIIQPLIEVPKIALQMNEKLFLSKIVSSGHKLCLQRNCILDIVRIPSVMTLDLIGESS